MTTTQQTGPRLTITGTCEGCCHIDPAKTWIGGKRKLFCAEPSLLGRVPRMIGGPQQATPAWCPLLPAARLALARSVVAEHDDAAPARGVATVFCEPWLSLAEMHDRLKCERAPSALADECSAAHGAGESEE